MGHKAKTEDVHAKQRENKIAKMAARLTTLRKEREVLLAKRNALENGFRGCAVEECGMEEELVVAKITKARSAPQRTKRLQAIHEAHTAILSKEAAMKEIDRELATVVETARLHKAKTEDVHAKQREN